MLSSMELTEVRDGRGRPLINKEVPFTLDELFFSRTNPRGVILFGNSVFQRVSLYPWDELIKKPHNVIRHPDTPRAVFWLLWDAIKKNEPIGAYVKNRAKDGRYYWVYAIVTPIEGGFLSVRLKPSSALFPVVEEEYRKWAAAERDGTLMPKDSADRALQRLAELGFNDYGAFMAVTLSQEIAARDRALGREPDKTIICFEELVSAAKSLLQQADAIFTAYAKNEYVPLNLQVQAAHLGQSGAAISVISNSYNLISAEIKANMNRFITSAEQVLKTINEGLFLLCTARMQHEMAEVFRDEGTDDAHAQEQEMRSLERQCSAYQRKAQDGLMAITDRAERFRQDCTEMKRLAGSLEVTRVMGKMESSYLAVAKSGLNELIDDLEAFQNAITAGLKEIDVHNQNIADNARRLAGIMESRAF